MRVTVGLPVHNAERTLGDAIRSVFAQTLDDWELIVVDDGSCDRSLQIAQAVNDSRVRVLSDGVNRGLVSRLNQIAGLARGDYLARMDADDLMHPERLALQTEYLDAHRETHLVVAAAYTIDAEDNLTGIRGLSPLAATSETALRGPPFIHPTVTGRRSWFRANPYDEAFVRAEDAELWCRTLGCTRVAKLDQPLLFYRDTNQLALRPYLMSNQTQRAIIARYGPALAGRAKTARLLLESHLKSGLFWLCAMVRLQGMLVGRRGSPLTEEQRGEAMKPLNTVLQTAVNGLPTVPRSRGTPCAAEDSTCLPELHSRNLGPFP